MRSFWPFRRNRVFRPSELPDELVRRLYRQWDATGQRTMEQFDLVRGLPSTAIDSALKIGHERGWIRTLYIYLDKGGYWCTVSESLSEEVALSGEYRVDEDLLIGGIDHGKWLMRAWYRKAFDADMSPIKVNLQASKIAFIR